MRAKPALRSTRAVAFALLLACLVSGCFALFSLDGYGPPAEIDGGDADSVAPSRTIFVTGDTFNGSLGGLDGGDSKCQAAAADAGLDGSYRAWLSDGSENAADRMVAGGPLRLANGVIVATTARELSVTGPLAPIVVDERGRTVDGGGCDGGLPVWTATSGDGGNIKSLDCARWGSSVATSNGLAGVAGGAGALWTAACVRTCAQSAALYCIEQ